MSSSGYIGHHRVPDSPDEITQIPSNSKFPLRFGAPVVAAMAVVVALWPTAAAYAEPVHNPHTSSTTRAIPAMLAVHLPSIPIKTVKLTLPLKQKPKVVTPPPPAAPVCTPGHTPHYWNNTQWANARTIYRVGVNRGISRDGEIIAIMTAMQESSLINLGNLGANNDHDSLGLFQQRPSSGWGTPAQVQDPVYAANNFYSHLLRVANWWTLAKTWAAQKVQISAFPTAYAKWETDATDMVESFASCQ